MPELPEVETIRRDLLPAVRGRVIMSAWVSENAPRLVQLIAPAEFERLLPRPSLLKKHRSRACA